MKGSVLILCCFWEGTNRNGHYKSLKESAAKLAGRFCSGLCEEV